MTCQVDTSITAHLFLNPNRPNHHRTDEAKEVSLASQLSKEEVRRKTEMRIEVPGDEWVENEVKFTEIVAFDGMEESAV